MNCEVSVSFLDLNFYIHQLQPHLPYWKLEMYCWVSFLGFLGPWAQTAAEQKREKGASLWQNHWLSDLCRSSGTLNTRKHNVSEAGSVSVLR
jgi:hypothetical protein